jgi:hypothetical protein
MVDGQLTTVRSSRLVGLTGLTSFLLIAVAALVQPHLWSAPGTTATPVQVAAYAQDDRGRALSSLFIYSVGMGLFLCFAMGLSTRLRQDAADMPSLSAAFAFGAVALVALVLAAFAPAAVLSYRLHDPAMAQALRDTTFGLLAMSGIPTALCLGAYAALVLRRGCLPAWTAWLAVLGAGAHLLIAASLMAHGGFLSLEGSVIVWVPGTFFAWILAVSLVLLRTPVAVARPTVS